MPKFKACHYILVLISLLSQSAWSQSLPSKQQKSIAAPVDVKIDGKINEWNGFEAQSKTNFLNYTLANNARSFFLVVQTTDLLAARKIIAGGISLIFYGNGKQQVVVSYPVPDKNMPVAIPLRTLKDRLAQSPNQGGTQDSVRIIANAEIAKKIKLIAVKGIPGVDDSISIYNDTGIKAASAFTHDLLYNLEFEIPVKYLQDLITNGAIKYTVQLNGAASFEGVKVEAIEGGIRTTWDGPRPLQYDVDFISSPTTITGEYILGRN